MNSNCTRKSRKYQRGKVENSEIKFSEKNQEKNQINGAASPTYFNCQNEHFRTIHCAKWLLLIILGFKRKGFKFSATYTRLKACTSSMSTLKLKVTLFCKDFLPYRDYHFLLLNHTFILSFPSKNTRPLASSFIIHSRECQGKWLCIAISTPPCRNK